MDPGSAVPNEVDPTKPSRACQACRSSKVRCRRPDDGQPCARCSKAGRACVSFEESNKRQKRFDNRLIDTIEARPSALTNAVRDRGVPTSSAAQTTTAEGTTVLDSQLVTALLDSNRIANGSCSPPTDYSDAHVEVSIRSIIDDEKASMIYAHFRLDMLQHLPFVTFPMDVKAEELRRNTPILLLAILDAAGDGFYDLEVARKLRRLLVKVYSTRLLGTNTHSMSLLQAFVVSVVWYKDIESPQAGEKMDVFHISHAAGNMAMMMGLEKYLKDWSWSTTIPYQTDNLRGTTSEHQSCTLEIRRIWVACYYICVNTSLASQTPNVMHWNLQMDECLEVLETSPAALSSDRVLCAHVRLQHILEEFEAQISSCSGHTAIEIIFKVAKRQLAENMASLHTRNDSLKLSQKFVTLYIHELAMTTTPSTNYPSEFGADIVTVSSSEFTDCLTVAHDLVESFLSLEIPLIRTLPTTYFVQITHTAIILVKLHFAAARSSEYAVHKIEDVKADFFLGRLLTMFSGWGTLWPAQKLLSTLRKLRELLRPCGNPSIASKMAWLNLWTLEEIPNTGTAAQADTIRRPSDYDGEDFSVSKDPESMERTILSTSDEQALACYMSSTDQTSNMQDTIHSTLPSASIDATQLVDWFGTDLNTSTFDFDGNLQSMIQFFD